MGISNVTLRWGHVQWVWVELDDDSDIVSVEMARKRVRTLCASVPLPLVIAGVWRSSGGGRGWSSWEAEHVGLLSLRTGCALDGLERFAEVCDEHGSGHGDEWAGVGGMSPWSFE